MVKKIIFLVVILSFAAAGAAKGACNFTQNPADAKSFSTPGHAAPLPSFNYDDSENPVFDKAISFQDFSICFSDGGVSYPCKSNDANYYIWQFLSGTPISIDTRNTSAEWKIGDLQHIFAGPAETQTVVLQVCDELTCCSSNAEIKFKANNDFMPKWKEISPF